MTLVKKTTVMSDRRKRTLRHGNLKTSRANVGIALDSCVVVAAGQEREWLLHFFKSMEFLINKHYRPRGTSKSALDVLVDQAERQAVVCVGTTSMIDLSKLVFTSGTGVSRKLRNATLRRGLKVRVCWNRFVMNVQSDVQNRLVLYAYNPMLRRFLVYELEENREVSEALIPFPKEWLLHTIPIWGFWYQAHSNGIIASSKNQYLGDFTLV